MKIMSVVTFKVKDGYQEEFTDAYRKAGSSSANFWRLVAVGEDTFVSINELPAVEDAVEREEVGIPWLDTVEHMLVKFGESRTSSFSGFIIEEYNNLSGRLNPANAAAKDRQERSEAVNLNSFRTGYSNVDQNDQSYLCKRVDEKLCKVIFFGQHRRIFRATGYLQCGPCRKRGFSNPYFSR